MFSFNHAYNWTKVVELLPLHRGAHKTACRVLFMGEFLEVSHVARSSGAYSSFLRPLNSRLICYGQQYYMFNGDHYTWQNQIASYDWGHISTASFEVYAEVHYDEDIYTVLDNNQKFIFKSLFNWAITFCLCHSNKMPTLIMPFIIFIISNFIEMVGPSTFSMELLHFAFAIRITWPL